MSRDRGNEDKALIYTVKVGGDESEPMTRAAALEMGRRRGSNYGGTVCVLKNRAGKAPVVVALWKDGVREV